MTEAMIIQFQKQYKSQPLDKDQYYQLIKFTNNTQPYLPFKELVFIELIGICALYCNRFWWNENGPIESLKQDLQKFKQKYYPFGFKINKHLLDYSKLNELQKYRSPRFRTVGFPEPYNPMEKIAFVKTQRACYKWLTSPQSNDNTEFLIDKLKQIALLVRK